MANPTTNFGWVMPTTTDLVTDLPADFNTFGQGVDTSMAELLGGTTGQILSKTSATNMDFTWITNDVGDITAVNTSAPLQGGASSGAVSLTVDSATTAATGVVQLSDSTSTTSSVLAATPTAVKSAYDLANAAIAKTTVTTAGDVIYRNATVPTRLGIGTVGQVLTVNSGATAPEWTTLSSGGWTLIATKTFDNTVNTYTFSSIPGTYTHLKLVGSNIQSNSTTNFCTLNLQFNADTGNNYNYILIRNQDGTLTSDVAVDYSSIGFGYIGSSSASSTAYRGSYDVNIYNYASASLYKTVDGVAGGFRTNAAWGYYNSIGGWNNTAAITSIVMKNTNTGTDNYKAGQVQLWGIS